MKHRRSVPELRYPDQWKHRSTLSPPCRRARCDGPAEPQRSRKPNSDRVLGADDQAAVPTASPIASQACHLPLDRLGIALPTVQVCFNHCCPVPRSFTNTEPILLHHAFQHPPTKRPRVLHLAEPYIARARSERDTRRLAQQAAPRQMHLNSMSCHNTVRLDDFPAQSDQICTILGIISKFLSKINHRPECRQDRTVLQWKSRTCISNALFLSLCPVYHRCPPVTFPSYRVSNSLNETVYRFTASVGSRKTPAVVSDVA